MSDQSSSCALEEGTELRLDFGKMASAASGTQVVPVAVQNIDTREVILVAYTNRQAFEKCVPDTDRHILEHVSERAVDQGPGVRAHLRTDRGPCELRAELTALSRKA